ncbi:MAG: hypothetical protein A2087_04535 [Spirochaetes bacterium GWD1_61_31]|nr:MAG: hypothetical protein A2Y37_06420 [Spirochaetes bacterium GWB1_60_80]OHD33455.1 MAG: hypothetical protein A2004_06225 [Spirochaetes bacterium GWC1_61_12]OHD40585.1 MAG: hypothetical protein A2087_04535 [Spirochaetes bacterium GWD1_61_31]OHD59284.1 MAG: hypothetical protein A2Y32_09800 [Spirochaetes bacterium GWF1_60_12]
MKLLLCAINARYTHLSPALRCLRQQLPDGFEVVLREYVITQPLLEICQAIALESPDVLLCSVYVWNSRHFTALLPDLRQLLPDCRLILGGPEVSWNADQWLKRLPMVDLIVCGAGELAIRQLAAAGFDLTAWPGRQLLAETPDFCQLPQPYTVADVPEFATRYVYYESARGCPFACSYCLSANAAHALQLKPVELVCRELDWLAAGQPRLVKFVDRTFNANPGRARAIWCHLAERHPNAGIRFHFEVHPALLEDDDFSLLGQSPAGLFQFELGVQTIHADTRREVGRWGDWPTERAALARLVALKTIPTHVDLIAGLPGDDLTRLAASLDELAALGADHLQLGFLKVLPGTPMAGRAAAYGLCHQSAAPYELFSNRWLTVAELYLVRQLAELIENVGNTHFYDELFQSGVRACGGTFGAYQSLLAYCLASGFDIHTRNREKVRPQLEAWLASLRLSHPD